MESAVDATPREPARVNSQPALADSVASAASNAVSVAVSVPAEAAIPTANGSVVAVKAKRKRSVDEDAHAPSQTPPQPTEEDEETESEVEMEYEAADERPQSPEARTSQAEAETETVGSTAERASNDGKGDESEEEEEEDEEFPPAPPLPSPSAASVVAPEPTPEQKPAQASPPKEATPPVQASGDRQPLETVDIEKDERLLSVLVSRRNQLSDPSLPKKNVWDAVARDLGGRFVDGDAAQAHVRWLQTVLRVPTHREWPRLSEQMKTMLAQVNAAMAAAETAKPAETVPVAAPVSETDSQNGLNKRRKVVLDEQTYLRIEREKLLNKQLQQQPPPPPAVMAPARPPVQPQPRPAPTTPAGVSLAPPVASSAVTTAAAPLDKAPLPSLPKQHVKSVLNVALEEKIMAIVLKHAPMFLTAEHRNDVWETIARDSRGRYESGASAKSHYVWLTQTVLNDPSHREYAKITPRLRSMCAKVQSYAAKRTKVSPANKPRPPVQAPVSAPIPAPPVVSSLAPTTTMQPKPIEAKKTPAAKPTKYESTSTVAAEFDEILMEQFLLKRPFDYDRYAKPAVWKEIAAIVPDPRVTSGVYGQKRVSWLAEVYRNPADKEHANLTPKLRKLLQEYADMLATGEAASKRLLGLPRKREIVALIGSNHAAAPLVTAPLTAAAPFGVAHPTTPVGGQSETIATQRPRRQNTKRVFDEYVTMDGSSEEEKETSVLPEEDQDDDMPMVDGEVTEATPYIDEVLIREILRVRPFHKKRGEGMTLWGSVQSAVARQIGSSQIFPTAERCWMHMRKLLSVVRNPKGAARVAVPSGQLEMLQLLDTVIKTKWPLTAHRLKNEHHALLHRIDAMLQRPFTSSPTQEGSSGGGTPESGPEAFGEDDEITQELWRDEADEDEEEDEEEIDDTPVQLTPQQVDAMRVLGPELLEALQPGLGAEAASLTATSGGVAKPEAVDGPPKSLEEQLKSCVHQLEIQSSAINQERDHHRMELQVLVEMLKEERAKHKRETDAMLAVIKQEREDRKSEFVAMMNLITRSVLPAEPPSH